MAELLSVQLHVANLENFHKWQNQDLVPNSPKKGEILPGFSLFWPGHRTFLPDEKDFNRDSWFQQRPAIDIEWKNLTFRVHENKRHKTILKNITGRVSAGDLTAIMGPSGAGKSTLLNILSGFSRQKIEGRILVNGQDRDIHLFHKLSCYILQDDNLLPHLTVKETVTFAANLKIRQSVPHSEKQKTVMDVLSSLGLTECQNTRSSQLSGGQRKRLSIAQELVSNPPVLFLDEPTSGLDSSSCLQCIKLLKSLACDGRTIICTIHQPSARIFEMFDSLYMLAEGQCIYRGSVHSLLPFLSVQGLSCPQYHNPADFVTEVATGEYGEWVKKLADAINGKPEEINLNSPSFADAIVENGSVPALNASTLHLLSEKEMVFGRYRGYATSSFNQFRILLYRSILSAIREPLTTPLRLVAHILVGLMIGLLYYKIGDDASKVFNNSAFLFFCLLFLIFTAMMPTVLTFPMEMSVFVREHLNSWYSTKMYYMAKTVADMPFQIVFPIIYTSIAYWMTAQPAELLRFGLNVLTSVMVSLIAQSMGLLIGAATSVQNAVFIAPVVSIPILLFSGFFISVDAIPPYLRWLSYLSYIRYAYESLLLAIYSFNRRDLECDLVFCPFQDPKDFLKEIKVKESELYTDYLALSAIFVVFRIMGYIMLRWRLSKRL